MAVTQPRREKPSALDQRRAGFARYKQDVKDRGKPFYLYDVPRHGHEPRRRVGDRRRSRRSGSGRRGPCTTTVLHQALLGLEYTAPADPVTTNFVLRPDSYFYFLFYLLRVFKWPNTVFLGTVGVPTIALMLLIALPFYDRRSERRLLRRPLGIGRLRPRRAVDGDAHVEGRDRVRGARVRGRRGRPALDQAGESPEAAEPGARLFAVAGCTACHTYLGYRLLEPRCA